MYMPQYCEGVNSCIYKHVAECNRIIRQMGFRIVEFAWQAVSNKLLCRWSPSWVGKKRHSEKLGEI